MNTFEITIPVLNEETTLETNIVKILDFLDNGFAQKNNLIYTIVIADNGSKDATPIIAQKLVDNFNGKVKFIKLPTPGVGLALKTSWLQSKADIVGYMDLDLATDLKHLWQVWEFLKRNEDIIYGSRLAKKSEVVGRTLKREITSRTLNYILKIVLNAKFSDGQCGFKFLKRDVACNLINTNLMSNGWFFCSEILLFGQYMNYKLAELPVVWTDDPNTKVNVMSVSIAYLKRIWEMKKIKKLFTQ